MVRGTILSGIIKHLQSFAAIQNVHGPHGRDTRTPAGRARPERARAIESSHVRASDGSVPHGRTSLFRPNGSCRLGAVSVGEAKRRIRDPVVGTRPALSVKCTVLTGVTPAMSTGSVHAVRASPHGDRNPLTASALPNGGPMSFPGMAYACKRPWRSPARMQRALSPWAILKG